MPIQFNTEKTATTVANQTDLFTNAGAAKGAKASSLLGGTALKVVDGSTTDLEKLVARLKSESDRARFSVLLTALSSIGQSLTDAQRRTLEQGLALAEKLEEFEKTLAGLEGEEAKAKADSVLLQAKIDSLQKQIDQAVQDGKDHNALVAEQKRVREELDAKQKVVSETQGKIADVKNEISNVRGQISALVSSIGENVVKTIANELAALSEPEKAERPAESAKEAEKQARTDPFASIRDSLDRIERDIAETIAENRVENV